jgi:hypothetical protein
MGKIFNILTPVCRFSTVFQEKLWKITNFHGNKLSSTVFTEFSGTIFMENSGTLLFHQKKWP